MSHHEMRRRIEDCRGRLRRVHRSSTTHQIVESEEQRETSIAQNLQPTIIADALDAATKHECRCVEAEV